MPYRDYYDAGNRAVETNVRLDPSEVPTGNPVHLFMEIYARLKDRTGFIPRSAFDPVECPRVLPYVQLFEEEVDGHFRCRLMGTEVVHLLGGEFTGKLLHTYIGGPVLTDRLAELHECLETAKPVFSRSVLPFREREHITVVRGAFPCRKDGTRMVFLPLAPIDVRL